MSAANNRIRTLSLSILLASNALCVIENTDMKPVQGEIIVTKIVRDAFEGKLYAEYDRWKVKNNVRKSWEVPPLNCKVTQLSGAEVQCHSADEVVSS